MRSAAYLGCPVIRSRDVRRILWRVLHCGIGIDCDARQCGFADDVYRSDAHAHAHAQRTLKNSSNRTDLACVRHDTHRETDRERDRCCRTHARTGPAHPAQPYTEHSVRAVSEHLVLRDRFSGVSTRTAKSILARQSPATVPLERQAAAAGLTACMLRCEQLGCAATAASSCISILLLAARLVAVRRAAFRLAVHVVQLACTHPNTGCEAETKPVLECLM